MRKVKLDKEMIESLLTEKGGMTKKTALELGLEYPLKSGWKQSLIGHKIEEDLYYKLTEQPSNDQKWIPPKSPDRILKEKSVLLDLLENPKLIEARIKALEAENEYLKMLIKQ